MNPFFEVPKKENKSSLFINLLQGLVLATSVFIVLYMFVITPNQVDGVSMEPNFYDKQLVFTNKLAQWIGNTSTGEKLGLDYQRGDIIITQPPDEKKAIIKRIIGVPGDKVAIREGYVYINNQKAIETDYLPPTRFTNGGDFLVDGGESKEVPSNSYIVLGDNRSFSRDSRYQSIGFIKREWIKGKVLLRFWPIGDLKLIQRGDVVLE